jgi:hypothetical protein
MSMRMMKVIFNLCISFVIMSCAHAPTQVQFCENNKCAVLSEADSQDAVFQKITSMMKSNLNKTIPLIVGREKEGVNCRRYRASVFRRNGASSKCSKNSLGHLFQSVFFTSFFRSLFSAFGQRFADVVFDGLRGLSTVRPARLLSGKAADGLWVTPAGC